LTLAGFALAAVFAVVLAFGAFAGTAFAGTALAVWVAVLAPIDVLAGALVSTLEFVFKSLIGGCVTVSEEVSAGLLASTEDVPEKAGSEINRADSIKSTAAVIVTFDKTVCVPRGPKALPEILLVNNAPASVLPGCSSTVTTSTRHEIKNIV